MILFALSLLLIIAFFYDLKVFIYSLMLFFVFFDMFDGFYKDDKIFAGLRYFIPLALLLSYTVKYNTLKKSDAFLLVLVLYLLLLWVVNAGDVLVSSRMLLSVLITLIMIPVGKHLGKEVDFIKEFEIYNRVLLISLPLYIIAANIFKIGESYTEAFSTGFLITSRMYVVPIVVFLAIHYAISNKDKSWLVKANDLVFILINICILLINTRRTAIGMLVGALFIYTLLNRQLILKMAILVAVMVTALVVSYPLYEARLTAQLEKRERIQNLDTYEEEGRVLETFYILDYHQRYGSIRELLFGIKLFDTYDFGTRYFGRDRPIHSDINMMFFSTGLVGVLLFALFFFSQFFIKNKLIKECNKNIYYPLLIMFLMVLLPGRFIGTMTYAPFLMLLLSSIKASRSEPVTNTTELHNQEAAVLAKV